MANSPPLLMIPGPIEVSPTVQASYAVPPPSHTSPRLIEAFGASLEMMRQVWLAPADAQPFVLAGGGTAAMEMAAANLVEPGDRVLVVNTGYFSDRIAEMLLRRGAVLAQIGAEPGEAPSIDAVERALEAHAGPAPVKALFATHVDTSTGVRIDPEPLAGLAHARGALSIFDGVCATAAERFDMASWHADVYLTASQKALGLPAGLALLVASRRAIEARRAAGTTAPPPLYLDWDAWLPIMKAYEQRRPSYFSTPATNLILALEHGLREILADGMDARIRMHERAAAALRSAWNVLRLTSVPRRSALQANTLSALWLPDGVDAGLVGRVLTHGVAVAGGLHPAIRERYFRVGHMGFAAGRPDMLHRTVTAIGSALAESGHEADTGAAREALRTSLDDSGALFGR